MKKTVFFLLLAPVCLAQQNLLLNGGFEGTLDGWITRQGRATSVERADAPQGRFVMLAEKVDFLHSQPILAEGGKTYTVSGWARAVTDSAVGNTLTMVIHPTPRLAGNPPFALGYGGHFDKHWREPVLSAQWQRFSFAITLPDYRVEKHPMPDPWWWDFKTWWLHIGWPGGAFELDGLSITGGADAPDGFVAESPVSVGVEIADLPPFNPAGSLVEKGRAVTARAGLHNTLGRAVDARVTWDLADYAGKKVFASETSALRLEPGATRVLTRRQTLNANGTLLLRCTVRDENGAVLGSGFAPATVLPFPQAATRVNPRERFGGTYTLGPPEVNHFMTAVAQKVGVHWTRWHPHLNWSDVQPDGPDQWNIPFDLLREQQSRGIACNIVLYSTPEWARGANRHLPKGMDDWGAADPRWDDLALETPWDAFVKGMARRLNGPAFVWEVANEPHFDDWNPAVYLQFVKRTARLIKSVDPAAKVMINSVNGFDGLSGAFAALGGAEFIDVFTFHNYGNGGFISASSLGVMRRAFTRKDGTSPEIWFNEGWTWFPTSRNAPGRGMLAHRTPEEAAHIFVRSQVEAFATGMDKMIYFMMTYSTHGRSWWDWGGAGTEMWDDHDEPTVAVPALNVLSDQLGLSTAVGTIRHDDAWIHVFHDQRNKRGLAVAWAARPEGVTLELPLADARAFDVMANPEPLQTRGNKTRIALGENSRPVYIFKPGLDGAALFNALKPLQRAVTGGFEGGVYHPPADWNARAEKGNPYVREGKPLWSFVRLMPQEPANPRAYITLNKWVGDGWEHDTRMFGGQPKGQMDAEDRVVIAARSAWGGDLDEKFAGIMFHAPRGGTWRLDASVHLHRWEGHGNAWLSVNLLDAEQGGVQTLARVAIANDADTPVELPAIELRNGQRLALLFTFDTMYSAGTFTFKSLGFSTAVE